MYHTTCTTITPQHSTPHWCACSTPATQRDTPAALSGTLRATPLHIGVLVAHQRHSATLVAHQRHSATLVAHTSDTARHTWRTAATSGTLRGYTIHKRHTGGYFRYPSGIRRLLPVPSGGTQSTNDGAGRGLRRHGASSDTHPKITPSHFRRGGAKLGFPGLLPQLSLMQVGAVRKCVYDS